MVALVDCGSISVCSGYFAVLLMILSGFNPILFFMQKNESFVLDNDIEKAYLCNVPGAGGNFSRGGAAR